MIDLEDWERGFLSKVESGTLRRRHWALFVVCTLLTGLLTLSGALLGWVELFELQQTNRSTPRTDAAEFAAYERLEDAGLLMDAAWYANYDRRESGFKQGYFLTGALIGMLLLGGGILSVLAVIHGGVLAGVGDAGRLVRLLEKLAAAVRVHEEAPRSAPESEAERP